MSKEKDTKTQTKITQKEQSGSTDTIEMALVGYQTAIDLWISQGDQSWTRFNVMLVVNTIILAVIGLNPTQNSPPPFTLLLPIAGLLICVIWFLLVRHEAENNDYYGKNAREIEQKYLSNIFQTLSRGYQFSIGNQITIEVDGQTRILKKGRLARIVQSKVAADWIIAIMTVLYLATIINSLF